MTATRPSRGLAPPNPYVGPRAFRRGELFFGRERESKGLVNALIAGRIVLLHAPSGAGKTSLIQAAVMDTMAKRNFQICARVEPQFSATQVEPQFSAIRLNGPLPDKFKTDNRYVSSAVIGLVGHLVSDSAQLSGWSIEQALDELARHQNTTGQQQLVVIDQFEEILRTDPTDFEGQRTFFHQLGAALDNPDRWALLAMREDYIGGLDGFLRYIPGQLRSTYRLDLLDTDAALRAIQMPADANKVEFVEDAARVLITDLQRVRNGIEDRETPRQGTYVEPVLLQVVCDGLWRKLSKDGEPFSVITARDVDEFRPLDTALARYYSFVVRKAAGRVPHMEQAVRDWVQEKLLSKHGLRTQTRSKPRVADPDTVLSVLQARYLVREDPRPNGTWWELSHDRLVDPILEDNRTWRENHLEPWQLAAYQWRANRHDEDYLLKGEALRVARNASRKQAPLTEEERDFLRRSEEAVAKEGTLQRAEARVDVLKIALATSLLFNALFFVFLLIWAITSF